KAIEIAYKSIRVRLSRSLLVTSGIVLALAFLMAILTTDAVVDSMRTWTRSGPASSLLERQKLESVMKSKGVPTSADEIADARLQTRWMIGLALLVAFVGILNAMLMSVTERFREIGTMKCLGALDSFIVKLFLMESLFQGIVGTMIGLVLGVAISLLMNLATYGTAAFHQLPVGRMAVAVLISAGVGVVLTVC